MPPRQPALPEGTDHLVRGASGSSGKDGGSFVASGADDGSGTERLVSQVREQVSTIKSQATTRIRGIADESKEKATGLLDDFSEVIGEAARAVDGKFGEDYGGYAHRAAGAVSGLADKVRGKSVDDLIDDTRDFVRKSPAIAIGIAAIAGFALIRLLKTGLEDAGVRDRDAANDGA
ncbi:MAG TPA: hypothetical protein VGO55_11925 [Allosphingosinicella sp.]|jgi:ElaB/YqjD/DUF883 family membrane-anchored ribosome-binding protein|nr:hypothetical protein [Allosphingosinicella sp.]